MGYGSQLIGLSDQSRQRGFAGLESGLSRLMAASQQASQQAFAAREARRQREFQEEQRKKQESAQKKAMWTSLGINAGAGAAGGAVTGALAASQPAISAAAPAMGEGLGVAAPAMAAAPTYTPFAGGSVGGGALAGGALGALGGLSGQNYLGSALAMPGQNYALASNAFNDANRTAMDWAKYAQSDRQNEADNTARIRAAELANERARYPWEFGVRPDTAYRTDAGVENNMRNNSTRMDVATMGNQTRRDINESRLPFLQGNLDERRRSNTIKENQGGRALDLREQHEENYGRYVSQSGGGMAPNISATPDPSVPGGFKFGGSGKNPTALIQGIDNARIAAGQGPADAYANAEWRMGNAFREGKSQQEALADADWMGTDEAASVIGRKLTPQEVARLKKRILGE